MPSTAPYTPGSHLLLLSQVPTKPNSKVRFLGCITHDPSSPPTATYITLTHPPSRAAIRVDISLVADTHAMGSLRDGEWVNVIGYTPADTGTAEPLVVRALLVWSAGAVRVGEYVDVVGGGSGS